MTLEPTTPDVGRRLKPQEMDLTEVHRPNCPYARMSVRQRRRALEASTPQIPSEMNKAVEAVRFVSAHLKNEDDFREVNYDRQLSPSKEVKVNTADMYMALYVSLALHSPAYGGRSHLALTALGPLLPNFPTELTIICSGV